MPEMILQRNYNLVTTRGHSVAFKKGVPTFVPPVIVSDATALGALMVDGSSAVVDELKAAVVGPTDPAEREAAVFAAFDKLSASRIREDFNAAGGPTTYAVNRALGWAIDARERTLRWDKYKTQHGE